MSVTRFINPTIKTMKTKLTILCLALSGFLLATNAFAQGNQKPTACEFNADMRKLWEDHITWTRNVILNVIDELPGTNEAVARLLQNQVDIGDAIKPYYGEAAGNQFTALLTAHITEAATILTALDDGDNATLTAALEQWYINADSIAAFLAGANSNWSFEEMQTMMHEHLDLTTAEALARKNADYAADVAAYDAVHVEILAMADMLAEGIVQQFPNKFKGSNHMRYAFDVTLSDDATLSQNSPNPFVDRTVISYSLPVNTGSAKIIFYNNLGSVIKTVPIDQMGEGDIKVYAQNLSDGIYSYSIVADGITIDTKRMIRQR
jgi:hypothetical protein